MNYFKKYKYHRLKSTENDKIYISTLKYTVTNNTKEFEYEKVLNVNKWFIS